MPRHSVIGASRPGSASVARQRREHAAGRVDPARERARCAPPSDTAARARAAADSSMRSQVRGRRCRARSSNRGVESGEQSSWRATSTKRIRAAEQRRTRGDARRRARGRRARWRGHRRGALSAGASASLEIDLAESGLDLAGFASAPDRSLRCAGGRRRGCIVTVGARADELDPRAHGRAIGTCQHCVRKRDLAIPRQRVGPTTARTNRATATASSSSPAARRAACPRAPARTPER